MHKLEIPFMGLLKRIFLISLLLGMASLHPSDTFGITLSAANPASPPLNEPCKSHLQSLLERVGGPVTPQDVLTRHSTTISELTTTRYARGIAYDFLQKPQEHVALRAFIYPIHQPLLVIGKKTDIDAGEFDKSIYIFSKYKTIQAGLLVELLESPGQIQLPINRDEVEIRLEGIQILKISSLGDACAEQPASWGCATEAETPWERWNVQVHHSDALKARLIHLLEWQKANLRIDSSKAEVDDQIAIVRQPSVELTRATIPEADDASTSKGDFLLATLHTAEGNPPHMLFFLPGGTYFDVENHTRWPWKLDLRLPDGKIFQMRSGREPVLTSPK